MLFREAMEKKLARVRREAWPVSTDHVILPVNGSPWATVVAQANQDVAQSVAVNQLVVFDTDGDWVEYKGAV